MSNVDVDLTKLYDLLFLLIENLKIEYVILILIIIKRISIRQYSAWNSKLGPYLFNSMSFINYEFSIKKK